jgi:hypothetical protein
MISTESTESITESTEFGLTNFVEIIILNSNCANSPRNQFDMMRTPYQTTLRTVLGRFNINKNLHDPFIIEHLSHNNVKLRNINYETIFERRRSYVFILKTINDVCLTPKSLFELLHLRIGSRQISQKYNPEPLWRIPPQMSSREKVFR